MDTPTSTCDFDEFDVLNLPFTDLNIPLPSPTEELPDIYRPPYGARDGGGGTNRTTGKANAPHTRLRELASK